MNTRIVRALALVATVAFAACGETTDLLTGELSEAEAQDLASALVMTTMNSTGQQQSQNAVAGGPQAAPYEYSEDVEGSIECPLGGTVAYGASVDISGDDETGASQLDYSMTQVHHGCVVVSQEQREFTLDGAPSLTLEFLVASNGQGVTEWDGSITGTVEWSTEDRSGSCTADFEFGGRREGDVSLTGELAGSVCGRSVQRSFSFGG